MTEALSRLRLASFFLTCVMLAFASSADSAEEKGDFVWLTEEEYIERVIGLNCFFETNDSTRPRLLSRYRMSKDTSERVPRFVGRTPDGASIANSPIKILTTESAENDWLRVRILVGDLRTTVFHKANSLIVLCNEEDWNNPANARLKYYERNPSDIVDCMFRGGLKITTTVGRCRANDGKVFR